MKVPVLLAALSGLVITTSLSATNYYCERCEGGYSRGYSRPYYDGYYRGYSRPYYDGYYYPSPRGAYYRDDRRDYREESRWESRDDDRYSDSDQKDMSPSHRDDHDLLNRVKKAVDGSGRYDKLDITVSDGVVTLNGAVETEQERQDLKSRIRKVDGVRSVNDKLRVERQGSKTSSYWNWRNDQDDDIGDTYTYPTQRDAYTQSRARSEDQTRFGSTSDQKASKEIQDILDGGMFTSGYKNVDFDIQDGRVTLRGSVEEVNDRQELAKKVQDIDGVRFVDNQIRIQQNPSSRYQNSHATPVFCRRQFPL